ncbi:hypothetical protein MASR2M70_09690 [Bacillota bacterium]
MDIKTNKENSDDEMKLELDFQEIGLHLSRSLFDNAPVAIIIYEVRGKGTTSADYIIKGTNRACLDIEDWHGKKVIGRALGELRPGVDGFGIIDIFGEVFRTGGTISYPAKVYKEGDEFRWFENTIFKLPTGEIVTVYSDVTERKQAQEDLRDEKERLKVTLYSIGDGVISTDKYGRVEILNQVAEELTGWKQSEAKGRPLSTVFDIYSESTGVTSVNPVEKVLKEGRVVGLANDTVIRSRNGKERLISDSAAPIKNQSGEIVGVVLVFRDVTEKKEKERRIEFLSYKDPLTGFYNRFFFEQKLQRIDHGGQLPLTIIMGDLDGLKLINDVYGHLKGDKALKKMAKIIEASCRESDLLFRWGGDEFVILLPESFEDYGQKICEHIKAKCLLTNVSDIKLSISLGCATKTDKNQKWQDVLKKAEDNMYKSKLLGAQSHRSNVLASIKNTLNEKSYETEEHGERIGKFCRAIGHSMGLTANETDELEVFAMLHDVGKIAIDDGILTKPALLSEDEMKVMKKHPEIGYRITNTIPELSNIALYILAHHERWDGAGYPRGLEGEEIPLQSRIMAVADAYDAMTQDRPYRKALSSDYAKEELRKNAGTQFDPKVVGIFLTHLEREWTGL